MRIGLAVERARPAEEKEMMDFEPAGRELVAEDAGDLLRAGAFRLRLHENDPRAPRCRSNADSGLNLAEHEARIELARHGSSPFKTGVARGRRITPRREGSTPV